VRVPSVEPTTTVRSRLSKPPVALTVAGSDPSGGAGIQADLKTFSALGAYGTSVITALTAQNTRGVTGVHGVPPEFIAEQLGTLLDDVRVDAVKTGMLGTAAVVRVVQRGLADARLSGVPVVVDPVMVATSGARLLDADAVAAVRELVAVADLVTPNLHEAAILTGSEPAVSVDQMRRQAELLLALGPRHVLVKGGHLDASPDAVDLLLGEEGEHLLRAERIPTRNTHGTGCSLSSAIAALRPRSASWVVAVTEAKAWLTEALRHADVLDVGAGSGPVHHFHESPRFR
jgi:hydroxymethylpyrimidine/phosphomethylpyrimidine kinase